MGKFVVISGIFILVGIIVVINLPIKKVECVTQYGPCSDYLQNRVPSLVGSNWISYIPDSVLIESFAGLPEVKKITVEKKIPGQIIINISLRKPLGVIYSTANKAQVAADDTGILFETKDSTNLPRLIVDSQLEIGAKLASLEFKALNILYQASVISQKNLTAKTVDNALEIKNDAGQLIIISLMDTKIDWAHSLQAILTRSKIDGKVPHKIDLRFADPVVVY